MTNVTGIPVGALANGTDGNLITWDASGVAAVVATGTATHVLTSNGAGTAPTFQAAAAGGRPTMKLSTIFETAARFASTLTNSGTATYGTTGLVQASSANASGGCLTLMDVTSGWSPFVGIPVFSLR